MIALSDDNGGNPEACSPPSMPWPDWCVDAILFTLQRDSSVRIRRSAAILLGTMGAAAESSSNLRKEISALVVFKMRDK